MGRSEIDRQLSPNLRSGRLGGAPSRSLSPRARQLRYALSLLLGLIRCAIFLLACGAAPQITSAAPPNIIFILVDDLGYADLGCYGCQDIRTPNMDRLAGEGLRFVNFYSNAPVCTPTRCAFITGRWQQRVGFEYAMGSGAENFVRHNGQWIRSTDVHGFGLPTTQSSWPEWATT